MQKSRNILWLLIGAVNISLLSMSITDAQSLEFLGSCDLTGAAKDIFIEDHFAFIGGHDPLLQIVNISDPTSPFIIGTYDTTAESWNLWAAKRHVFIAGGWNGLFIVNVMDPVNPILVSIYNGPDFDHDIVVENDLAYLLNCHQFNVLDITDLENPILLGDTLLHTVDAWNFTIKGSYAYVADRMASGMRILNIDDPYHPMLITRYEGFYFGFDISVWQDYAYIPYVNGLQIVDIADPFNPFVVNVYDSTNIGKRVFCEDNYVFLASENWRGITILDISNPILPRRIYNYTLYRYFDLFYRDGILYAVRIIPRVLDIFRFTVPTNNEDDNIIPDLLQYLGIYPNPFNSSTTISFTLNEPSVITLSVYNIQGQRIAELFRGILEAGGHAITWDAWDYPSGVYFARLEAGGSSKTAKMVLLK